MRAKVELDFKVHKETLKQCGGNREVTEPLQDLAASNEQCGVKGFLVVFAAQRCFFGEVRFQVSRQGFELRLRRCHVLLKDGERGLTSLSVLRCLVRGLVSVSGVVHATDDIIEPAAQNRLAESLLVVVHGNVIGLGHAFIPCARSLVPRSVGIKNKSVDACDSAIPSEEAPAWGRNWGGSVPSAIRPSRLPQGWGRLRRGFAWLACRVRTYDERRRPQSPRKTPAKTPSHSRSQKPSEHRSYRRQNLARRESQPRSRFGS